jgi:hypothetical protein
MRQVSKRVQDSAEKRVRDIRRATRRAAAHNSRSKAFVARGDMMETRLQTAFPFRR